MLDFIWGLVAGLFMGLGIGLRLAVWYARR